MGTAATEAPKITFKRKDPDSCPVCGKEFYREEMYSGGGRLIAGPLKDDLRRTYQENKRFGVVIPMIYSVIVCPHCFYSAFPEDFYKINDKIKSRLGEKDLERINFMHQLFPGLDFNERRNIEHGLASYMLATTCYSFFERKYAPTLRRGQTCLRMAWLLEDMEEAYKDDRYKKMEKLFYQKAAKYWSMALMLSQSGKEPIDSSKRIGPDTDKDYGYDGLVYLVGILRYRMLGAEKDEVKKGKEMMKIARLFAKLYAAGKSSKDKPKDILDRAKDYYDELKAEIRELESKTGQEFS